MMTILVTGSAGHLGEALMRSLREGGESVRGIDIKASPFTDSIGSITDRAFVRACMKGVQTVMHTATLHKPHVATHSKQDFIDTNITGTLILLEEALAAGVNAFIFTSTTSTFGAALTPAAGEPATWITEDVTPVPKNIYGVTKIAGEDLCHLFFRKERLPVIVLRTSRFFPEEDDDATVRDKFQPANVQANELLNRRVDVEDVVSAHVQAARKAHSIGFGRYIVSATTPFTPGDLALLRENAADVVRRLFPECDALYANSRWQLPAALDRVYVNQRALAELDWQPKYDFRQVLESLRNGRDFASPLARAIGSKGYHGQTFDKGPYPIA